MTEVGPLAKIDVIGKRRRKDEPFPVSRQRGFYFFIRIDQLDHLRQINEAYKTEPQTEAKPLEEIKIVGRGGVSGYRPFLIPGYPGLYLCILAEHLRQLEKINLAYTALLKDKEQKKVPEHIAEPTRPIEFPAEIETIGAEEPAAIEPMPKIEELKREAEALPKPEEIEKHKPAKEEGRYVYCVIPWEEGHSRLSFGGLGIEDSGEVYAIPCGNIAAIVSNVPFKEYVLTDENARAHNQVITLVMEKYPAVPAEYGTVFKNEEILRKVFKRIRHDLKKALKDFGDKVEMDLEAIQPKGVDFDKNAFISEIRRSNLSKISVNCKLGKKFSKRLILNVFYLMAKERIKDFVAAAKAIEEKFQRLKIRWIGPWPPFNFVAIKVGRGEDAVFHR